MFLYRLTSVVHQVDLARYINHVCIISETSVAFCELKAPL